MVTKILMILQIHPFQQSEIKNNAVEPPPQV